MEQDKDNDELNTNQHSENIYHSDDVRWAVIMKMEQDKDNDELNTNQYSENIFHSDDVRASSH